MNAISSTKQDKSIFLSKKGIKEVKKSIDQLRQDLQAVTRSLREADKTNGHDDRFERNEKLLRMESLATELAEKQRTLQVAKLMPSKRDRVRVAVGSVVDLLDQHGRMVRYTLVESIEANPSDGRISTASPLGSNLIGKAVKDIVIWSRGANQNTFQLVGIS